MMPWQHVIGAKGVKMSGLGRFDGTPSPSFCAAGLGRDMKLDFLQLSSAYICLRRPCCSQSAPPPAALKQGWQGQGNQKKTNDVTLELHSTLTALQLSTRTEGSRLTGVEKILSKNGRGPPGWHHQVV